MSISEMLELLVLKKIMEGVDIDPEYEAFLKTNYNYKRLNNRYLRLGQEFLNDYAWNKTEKSEEND